MTLNCLIIDDEPLALDLLSDYVDRLDWLNTLATFTNPVEALTFLREQPADVLFLDIQMPELSGLDFIRIVGPEQPVILTTAYGEYALESYEFRVFDYLLKPISFERFERAGQRVRTWLGKDPDGSRNQAVNPLLHERTSPAVPISHSEPTYIFVKSGQQTLRIDLADIRYCSGSGDYLTIFLTDGRKVLTLENLSELAARLPERDFVRIHRSHIVALGKVDFIERRRVAVGKERLPISDSYAEGFWKKLG